MEPLKGPCKNKNMYLRRKHFACSRETKREHAHDFAQNLAFVRAALRPYGCFNAFSVATEKTRHEMG